MRGVLENRRGEKKKEKSGGSILKGRRGEERKRRGKKNGVQRRGKK